MLRVHLVLAANKLWSVKYIIGGLLYFQLISSVTLDTYSCSILGPRASQTQFILQFIIFLVSAAKRKATLSSHNHINILQKTNDISEGGGNVFQAQIEQNARGFFLGQTKLFRALSLLMNILKKNSIKGFVQYFWARRGDDSSKIWKITPQGKVGWRSWANIYVVVMYLYPCNVLLFVPMQIKLNVPESSKHL